MVQLALEFEPMPSQIFAKMESTSTSTTTSSNNKIVEQLQLPAGLHAMATQVAGHTFDVASLGLLQDGAGCVLKPLGKPQCGERELKFYETLQHADDESDAILLPLRSLVPKFYRKLKLAVNKREHTFLQLEDLTYGMRKPCIMDIKVGKRTWDPLATHEKRLVEEQKYVRCKQVLGLCVPGFQVYTFGGSSVLRYSKEYGKKLDTDGFRATIALFLNAQEGAVCEALVAELLKQLYNIRNWFHMQTLYHFYASSLLILYDFEMLRTCMQQKSTCNGEQLTNGDVQTNYTIRECSAHGAVDWVKVKMIDFAHVFPSENCSTDTNYMFGLEHLITVLEELQQR